MSARGLDHLFAPRQIVVLGAPRSAGQRQIAAHLAASLVPDRRMVVGATLDGWKTLHSLRQLAQTDLAVVFDGRVLRPASFRQLGALGCGAAIVATDIPLKSAVRAAAAQASVRILGSRSAGVARGPFKACAFAQAETEGRIALICQSRTIMAAALDWARGRRQGLAWLASTGSEDDIEVADLLDYAALDPSVKGVVVQLGRVRDGRRFMSAARATARTKPVAVLQTHDGREILFPALGADPLRSAAFARAGLVECESLGGLFDAIALLDVQHQDAVRTVAVIGNGAGVCALGVDALLREGVHPAMLSDACRGSLRRQWPLARVAGGAVDLGTMSADTIVAVAEDLLATHGIGTVLLMHSPEPGHSHAEVARAVTKSSHASHIATVWLGLETARRARDLCAERDVATFVSPEDAARALRYPRQHLRTQEALMQTPPLWRHFAPKRSAAEGALNEARTAKTQDASNHAAVRLLEAYGVGRRRGSAAGPGVRLRVFQHAEFGSCLALRVDVPGVNGNEVFSLPPLDAVLARRVLEDAGFHWDGAEPRMRRDLQRLGIALIRVASLVVEQPRVAGLRLRLAITRRGGHCHIVEARVRLADAAPDERKRLVLAPYPAELTRQVELGSGLHCTVRAIRPEDEPALIEMLDHTDPEAIRLRFFHMIRYFTHAMAARFSQIDYERELVLVAVQNVEEKLAIIGSGHLSLDDGGTRAEYAVLVHQDYARHGLGSHLLRRLLDYAAQRGVHVVYGEVLAENAAMRKMVRRLGFHLRGNPDDPTCLITEFDVSGCDHQAVDNSLS